MEMGKHYSFFSLSKENLKIYIYTALNIEEWCQAFKFIMFYPLNYKCNIVKRVTKFTQNILSICPTSLVFFRVQAFFFGLLWV